MTVLIFANGEISPGNWLTAYMDKADMIIAADGGANRLLELGYYPDVVVGDLDSLDEESREKVVTIGSVIVKHPIEKDETDLELALIYAVDHYEDDILIFGFLGGRLDQTLANVMLLAHPDIRSRSVKLLDKWQTAWLVNTATQIQGSIGDTLSLLPVGGEVRVDKTNGLRWDLADEVLSFGPARGVSNELTAEFATVAIKSGTLLCVHTRREWDR